MDQIVRQEETRVIGHCIILHTLNIPMLCCSQKNAHSEIYIKTSDIRCIT
ncbi:hypothetical protein SEUBUCD646_0B02230 [Saccharomyces eubayanus]|uniref:Uncharacterized protein n=1 Tax=Saccharomyces eubayanus TaxID=1080349 RepID=A0ABN8VJZ4_SACEU|nr:hypothetical protein SEUBUCD650_0B02240 [Saccharomyces eubayanus]CAI1856995.1 hypothetical protein SEUBUCD646_0B02230 [Saccharomyces eubayanus]